MDRKLTVLLITEGTYPYHSGGVSTWAQQLCNGVRNANFKIYSINAVSERSSKFHLGPQVREVVQLPMWAAEEPQDLQQYEMSYTDHVIRRELVSEEVVVEEFLPFFTMFLDEILKETQDLKILDRAVRGLFFYFQKYDYKTTMRSYSVWESFRRSIAQHQMSLAGAGATLSDLTTAMRWLYRFLIPVSVPAPKTDLVHLTVAGSSILPALGLKYKYGTPILLTEHGVYIRERLLAIGASAFSPFLKIFLTHFSEAMTRLSYFHADRITTVSRFNIPWEVRYGADRDKIEVIYNGVDLSVFKPRHKKEQNRPPTVVAAARLFALKDILTMIRTCAEVRKTIPSIQFKVFGNKDAVPEYTAECEHLIQELDLEGHFHLCGHHPDPAMIYGEGDLSILSSVSEGFPYTVLESMASGIPVVATAVGGVPEALDVETGRLCPPRDPVALGAAVVELLQHTELREAMGIAARKKASENFRISSFSEAFERLYTELLQKEPWRKRQIV